MKWEAALAASTPPHRPPPAPLDRLSAYHRPPSNTVVVSSVFLGEVIFKMMKEGFAGVFDDHMLHLMYNQQINSTVKGMNIGLSFAM